MLPVLTGGAALSVASATLRMSASHPHRFHPGDPTLFHSRRPNLSTMVNHSAQRHIHRHLAHVCTPPPSPLRRPPYPPPSPFSPEHNVQRLPHHAAQHHIHIHIALLSSPPPSLHHPHPPPSTPSSPQHNGQRLPHRAAQRNIHRHLAHVRRCKAVVGALQALLHVWVVRLPHQIPNL